MARKTKPRTPGGQRGNNNAAKPPAERKLRVNVNLTPAQANALAEIGGTTTGLNLLLNAAAGAVPVARTFRFEDGTWYAVWTDARGDERETDAACMTEYAARLISAYEWMTSLAHANHMARA